MNDSDISSPADDDEDDELEDNFVFVPRQPSCINPTEANDSIAEDYSVEETSPFSSDVAVRRRTMERLDSVISVGSRWGELQFLYVLYYYTILLYIY